MTTIHVYSRGWSVRREQPMAGARRVRQAGVEFPFRPQGADVEELTLEPTAANRRAAAPEPIDFECSLAPGEASVLALRHPSGALTFHLPVQVSRRGSRTNAQHSARFTITVRAIDPDTGRRGAIGRLFKAFMIKVGKALGDKVVSMTLPKLAAAFEADAFRRRGLREGFVHVTRAALAAKALPVQRPAGSERSLLLLHGTFSNAAAAFHALAKGSFFERTAPLYGDRIFAFDHFSLSRTPEDNARMLLQQLPERSMTFDVITHSRGGLVLRNLVERTAELGALSRRFRLGHAVLVASPNDGTPLANGERWKDALGWIANLLELFPDNPFTTGVSFVSDALVWLAKHVTGDLPGLAAMDATSDTLGELQAPPGPPPAAYSALVSNYNPTRRVLARMLDCGVDQFFGSANDLVVPADGGYRIDRSGIVFIPAGRVGCFGPGGNLPLDAVTHVDFFSQPQTVDFLVNALHGQPQPLAPMDLTRPLPDRRLFRSLGERVAASPIAAPAKPQSAARTDRVREVAVHGTRVMASDSFHLVVMPRSNGDDNQSQILAHYGSARVLEPFYLKGTTDNAGKRWQTIIARSEVIKNYVDLGKGHMPTAEELREFGQILFETLFPGAVRRLYDTARSLQGSERLDVILTSTIPWVANKPWEFAYDPVRKTALATEELHFIRNVMTAVPAEVIDDRQPLRILVASSQPLRLGKLSIKEEEAVIRRGFEPLREANLAEVEVLARATPASLHGYVSTGRFSIVHFIGHGEYDAEQQRGFLVFQDEQGNPYPVDDRSAREILCGRSIRLVFLNACETGQGGHADFNSGIAPALMAGGVPIVVANQYKVLDTSATTFAQHFYWSLAHGMSVGESAREARIAVNYSLSGESIDWAVPVVYAKDPNSRLSPKRSRDPRADAAPSVRVAIRRAVTAHVHQVAVWDVHSQFPALRATLERFNAVQNLFGFDLVDLSLPMDAWYVNAEAERFLDADLATHRLSPQVSQLGVRYISAIVDAPLARGLETKQPSFYEYGYWTGPGQPPVLLFSTYGFDLDPTGIETERVLTNVTVAGLAGHLDDTNFHVRGARDCPRHYNPQRNATVIKARQRFCKACMERLRKTHPDEFRALSGLLKSEP